MKDLRNPIKREKEFNHPAGNVMMELEEYI